MSIFRGFWRNVGLVFEAELICIFIRIITNTLLSQLSFGYEYCDRCRPKSYRIVIRCIKWVAFHSNSYKYYRLHDVLSNS